MSEERRQHRVRIIQEGNWKYAGTVLSETETHLTILDDKSGREITARKNTLLLLEVLT